MSDASEGLAILGVHNNALRRRCSCLVAQFVYEQLIYETMRASTFHLSDPPFFSITETMRKTPSIAWYVIFYDQKKL